MVNAVFLFLPCIILRLSCIVIVLDPYWYGLKISLQKNEFPDFDRRHSGLLLSKHYSIINYIQINIISLRKQKNSIDRFLEEYPK
jgi:hypothetical protein